MATDFDQIDLVVTELLARPELFAEGGGERSLREWLHARLHELDPSRLDELLLRILAGLAARAAEGQSSDTHEPLDSHLLRGLGATGAGAGLRAALIARNDGRLRMHESYEGVVKDAWEDGVLVVYEVGDELVEQTYLRSQFLDGELPKLGDRLAVYVHVAKLPPAEEKPPPDDALARESADERPRRRKNVVPLPRTF